MSNLLEHLCACRVSRGESFLDRRVVANDGVAQCSVEKRNRRIRAVSRTHETIGCHDDFVKNVGGDRDLVLIVAQHTGQNNVKNVTGLLAGEFIDDDRRETALERRVVIEFLRFTHGRCCDHTDVPSGHGRLENLCDLGVGCVVAVCDEVNLIDKEQCIVVCILRKLDDFGDAVFEITDNASACNESCNRQLVDRRVCKLRRHRSFFISDAPGDLFDNRRLAHSGWANE